MASSSYIVILCLLSLAAPAFANSQIFRYTDDSGTLNYTNDWKRIPEQYRNRAVPLEPDRPPPVETPAQPPLFRIVTSVGEYRMTKYDTRIEATRMAIEDAKRQALERAAMYLESVTEVHNLDVTRDEIRTYSAGMVRVLNQRITTRLEDGDIVVHVDLTAQVDEHEVIQAITSLRENESVKQELIALQAKTDQLRQEVQAANQALAAASTPEQVQALTLERQQLLDRMQADALMARAKTGKSPVTAETEYPSSLARLKRFLAGGLP
ncbi:MAG TPA: DUF4124 domain-containing protein [Nitrospira sp.]|nr:DUF4124 domain-containing protein [Nitrospira sp.]